MNWGFPPKCFTPTCFVVYTLCLFYIFKTSLLQLSPSIDRLEIMKKNTKLKDRGLKCKTEK